MQKNFQRYALFFTLPSGALADFGAAWLGWDSAAGCDTPHPNMPGLGVRDISQITERPRKYGFHATIKAPFRLADGTHANVLVSQLDAFCRAHSTVTLPMLQVSQLGRFLALTLSAPCPELTELAANVVRDFDPFRAPLTEADWARRTQHPLSPEKMENLRNWGYPHVMGAYNFHMTLTGPLSGDMAAKAKTALTKTLSPMLNQPFPLDAISLLGEAPSGRFHLLKRVPLSGEGNQIPPNTSDK